MIEAVTFDWWGTVAATPARDYDARMRDIRVRAIADFLRRGGFHIDEATLYRAYDLHTDLLRRAWAEDVDLDADEQVTAFLSLAGLGGEGHEGDLLEGIQRAIGEAMFRNMPDANPHIAETLGLLKARGYRIGMISNTGRTWGRFLRRVQEKLDLAQYFEVRTFSDEVKVRKPGREIFDRTVRALRLEPSHVVHVGDDVTADIAGAKGIGMRAVWYDTGYWAGAETRNADAVIHHFAELPPLLEEWRTR